MKIRKLCASRVEWKYIYQLTGSIEDDNIRNYITNQIEWFVVKANQYKFWEYMFKALTVITPTVALAVQNKLAANNMWGQLAVLGGATIASASGVFLMFHDKRVLYRKSAELIKSETLLYITHVGEYSGEDCNERFVLKLDNIARNVNEKWGQIEDNQNKAEDKNGSSPDKKSS